MKTLLWLLLGFPVSFLLGLVTMIAFAIVLDSGFEMDRPPTKLETIFDDLSAAAFFIVGLGSWFYSLCKAYLILRDG